jgi:hypothetical protein
MHGSVSVPLPSALQRSWLLASAQPSTWSGTQALQLAEPLPLSVQPIGQSLSLSALPAASQLRRVSASRQNDAPGAQLLHTAGVSARLQPSSHCCMPDTSPSLPQLASVLSLLQNFAPGRQTLQRFSAALQPSPPQFCETRSLPSSLQRMATEP